MHDLRHILAARNELLGRGADAVLGTVVKVEGSTYRRPGARLLIGSNGQAVGGVSGGCLEGDLVRKAWWRTADGPVVVTYDSRSDDDAAWQFGLGCNGVVHVLLERLTATTFDPLSFVQRCGRAGSSGVLATAFRSDLGTGVAVGDRLAFESDAAQVGSLGVSEFGETLAADMHACLQDDRSRTAAYVTAAGEVEVAIEVVRPPIRLFVFGGGFDAVPLVAAARAVGWETVVVDRRAATTRRHRAAGGDRVLTLSPALACERLRPTPRTAAVVMNHNLPDDREAVAALLGTDVRYVGVLGPKARTQKLLADIPDAGGQDLRLHAPVGLDVGAETPEEIAAAVVAQVLAVFADRGGGHLRDRAGPIHRREPSPAAAVMS